MKMASVLARAFLVYCMLPKCHKEFPQNTKWSASSVFFNQPTCKSSRRRKDYFLPLITSLFFLFTSLFSPPHLPPGSPKWRLWEAVQHLPQTAHHQNGVSHQSESAWPIKPSASLPHHSLSLSQTLLLVQVCLCRGEVSGCIENSGFYTNGLSRICNVTFL